MNTVTSRRGPIVMPPVGGVKRENAYLFLALVGGLLLMVLGIRTNMELFMVPGFVAFVYALLYLNCKFWAHMYEKHEVDFPRRINWL